MAGATDRRGQRGARGARTLAARVGPRRMDAADQRRTSGANAYRPGACRTRTVQSFAYIVRSSALIYLAEIAPGNFSGHYSVVRGFAWRLPICEIAKAISRAVFVRCVSGGRLRRAGLGYNARMKPLVGIIMGSTSDWE